jgi:hypothetical protein
VPPLLRMVSAINDRYFLEDEISASCRTSQLGNCLKLISPNGSWCGGPLTWHINDGGLPDAESLDKMYSHWALIATAGEYLVSSQCFVSEKST